MTIQLSYDRIKRSKTLAERGLDFEHAGEVLEGTHLTYLDERFEYAEERWITVGYLRRRMVVMVWTKRGKRYNIISMRKANEKEQKRYKKFLDRSG